MRLSRWLAGCVLLAAAAAGCASPSRVRRNPSDPAYYPVSRQVSFVESYGSGETMVRATGKGDRTQDALDDSKRAALWFLLYAGDRPIVKQALHKSGQGATEAGLFDQVDGFIRFDSGIKDKRVVGGVTSVTALYRLDVAAISQALVDQGALASTDEAAAEIGLPTLGVQAEGGAGGDAGPAAVTVLGYLQDRGFEVFDLASGQVKSKAIRKLAELEGVIDPTFASALDQGSDILVSVAAYVVQGRDAAGMATFKATVTLNAHDVASGSSAGAATGHSREMSGATAAALVEEATHDAVDKVTSQIKKTWSKQRRSGRAFKVVLMSDGEDASAADEAMYGVLKGVAKRGPVKRLGSGPGIATYVVFADATQYANAYDLFLSLRKKWPGPGDLKKVKDSGALLIAAGGGGEIEIEIE